MNRLETPTSGDRTADWRLLIVLLSLTAALRLWIVASTEVPARDSIGFIRQALEYEELSWVEVLNKNQQHPGYSVSVWLVSLPVRGWYGGVTPLSMQLSAQLASSIAGLLLVVPMYWLGRIYFDRQVSFWAALLFQLLPVSGPLLSDGVSESLFLCMATTAVFFAAVALNKDRWLPFGVAGVFAGLAYLTRPEGAFVVVATSVVLVGKQFVPDWRVRWSSFGRSLASLLVGFAVLSSVYVLSTSQLTNKPSAERIWEGRFKSNEYSGRDIAGPSRLLFAAVVRDVDSHAERLRGGIWATLVELIHAFHYFGGLFAVFGLYWYWHLARRHPGYWVMLLWGVLQLSAVIALAIVVGYVSDRHLLVLVLTGCFFAAAGVRDFPLRLTRWLQRWRRLEVSRSTVGRASTVLLLALALLCLPKTLRPLHGNRAGHHAAGIWLGGVLRAGDVVDDDHCWSHYYAGQVFKEGKEIPAETGYRPKRYIVITRSRHPETARVRLDRERRIRQREGVLVYHWPEGRAASRARVVVYAMPGRSGKEAVQ